MTRLVILVLVAGPLLAQSGPTYIGYGHASQNIRQITYLGDFDGDGLAHDSAHVVIDLGYQGLAARVYLESNNLGIFWYWQNTYTNDPFVAAAGDVDGDGRDDVVRAIHDASSLGLSGNGIVQVFGYDPNAPSNYKVIRRWDGWTSGQSLGTHVVSPGDMDNDGTPDLLVADDLGTAYLFSSATGAPIIAHSFGTNLAVGKAGDANNDGTPDYAILEDNGTSATCHIFSGGVPGGLLGTPISSTPVPGYTHQVDFRCRMVALGDTNGDGYHDVGVGTTGQNLDAGFRAISGIGGVLYHVLPTPPGTSQTYVVWDAANVHDQDGDGVDDVYLCMNNPGADSGIYSGATGAQLWTASSLGIANGNHYSATQAGDYNGNGYDGFIVATPSFVSGGAWRTQRIYSGGPAPTDDYPGSGDDLLLESAILPGGSPGPAPLTTGPAFDVKTASGGDWAVVHLSSPNGAGWGENLVLGISSPFATGATPPQQTVFPTGVPLHIGNPPPLGSAMLLGFPATSGPLGSMVVGPLGTSLTFQIPMSLAGMSVIAQGAILNPMPTNIPFDLLWLTDGHELQIQ